ncbi:hypothetical protein [Edaphobacter bradus]|uniref:hypothetical protein n=1 Tax=Edaphobacter bradus TaxID=2259016 RepID=UPI0021E05C9A|nr:hypothetical protein [Edaphobacter bradus]
MKNRSLFSQSLGARFVLGFLIAVSCLTLSSCGGHNYYKFPTYTFANRPIPPSRLANRVMVSVTANGSSGSLQILDSLRDIRMNVQNTIPSFSISGYASGFPNRIFNFPEQVIGYVYSSSDGSLNIIDYGKESTRGSGGTLPAKAADVAVPFGFAHVYGAIESLGEFVVIDNATGKSYVLSLPNVYKVAANQGDTVVLAMVRNSNTLYRLVHLNNNANQPAVPGAVDCQPVNLPVYCVVPVPDSPTSPSLDRPVGAYFSLDGTTAYVLDCGSECGGNTSGLTILQQGNLEVTNYPTSTPYPSPVTGSVAVPGGATTVLADGTNLYIAGQQLQPDGLFTGYLSIMSLATNTVTGKYSISDGYHSKLLFADDNTLWIGSQSCATGERQKLGLNYNCLTRFDLGAKTASIVPNVNPKDSASSVPYPNTNQNQYYYGDLTGLCWVQNLHKVYTAYGGQVHAFHTTDGSEIDNSLITVQGTALDTAYMDAITNDAN